MHFLRTHLLCIVCFFSLPAFGQNGVIDSLREIIQQGKLTDTARVNRMQELGIMIWRAGHDEEARSVLQDVIETSKTIGFPRGEAMARLQLVRMEMERMEEVEWAHRQLDTAYTLAGKSRDKWLEAMCHFRRGQLYSGFDNRADTISKLYEQAREIFVQKEDRSMEGTIYMEMGLVEAREGRYAAAADYLQKARGLQETVGDLQALRATLPNLGIMLLSLRMYEPALAVFAEAESNARKLNDDRVVAFVDYQRGEIFGKTHQLDSALTYYSKAARFFERSGASTLYINILSKISGLYLQQGNTDSALAINQRAYAMHIASFDPPGSFFHNAVINFGRIYNARKAYDKALQYGKMGRDALLNEEINMPLELSAYYEILGTAYAGLGDYRNAYENMGLYKSWSDSLVNIESREKAMADNLTYEHEKKQNETALLLEKSDQENLRIWRMFLIVLLGIAVIISIAAWYNYLSLAKKNRQLHEKNIEIERALNAGQRLERKRLAAELHDNLNTQISAIKWTLETLDTKAMQPQNLRLVEKAVNMAEDLYTDLRLISHLLLPAALEANDLQGALQKLVNRMNEHSQIDFALHYEAGNQIINEQITQQLYNICLELVNNVARHSNANKAIVTVQMPDAEHIRLVVEDDGSGIRENETKHGIGMQNIRYRAHSIGGEVRLDSPTQGGTSISVLAPLKPVHDGSRT